MNAEQIIKEKILEETRQIPYSGYTEFEFSGDLAEGNIDGIWQAFVDEDPDNSFEMLQNFRCSGKEIEIDFSGIPVSKEYECQIDAIEAGTLGLWIAWPYYSGGGKHGQPGRMPWLEHAFFVKAEVVWMIPEYKFSRIES